MAVTLSELKAAAPDFALIRETYVMYVTSVCDRLVFELEVEIRRGSYVSAFPHPRRLLAMRVP